MQWVRLYKLSSDDVPRVQDAYSFDTKAAPAAAAGTRST